MSILVDEKTQIIVQGITGRDGSFHARAMRNYGTQVVGGVTPGKGGQKLDNIPVFNSVDEAVTKTGAKATVIFVPAAFCKSALQEAMASEVELIVCITEGIPTLDMITVVNQLDKKRRRLIGPNCPGIISPGKTKLGIMPGHIHRKGNIGVISRSGTLTYEVVYQLSNQGLGQSTCVGIGGDPILGTNFIALLELMEQDPETEAIVLVGEIGGSDEEKAAHYIQHEVTKPVVAFIAGRTAPPGKRMGHAGAIIAGTSGTAEAKIAAFNQVGVPVATSPAEIPNLLKTALNLS